MPEKTIKRRLQDCDAARLSCHVPRGTIVRTRRKDGGGSNERFRWRVVCGIC